MHATKPVETKISITQQKDYWVERLGGYLPVIEVPLDYPRSPGSQQNRATEAIEIDNKLCLEIEKLLGSVREKSEKVTVFAVILAAFKVVWHRYTGVDDIVVGGLAVGNKGNLNVKETAIDQSKSVKLLALRTNLTGNQTVAELLDRVGKTVAEAQANRDYPIEQLWELKEGENQAESSPWAQICRVMLVECDEGQSGKETLTKYEAIAEVEKKGENWILVLYDRGSAGNLTIECQYNGGLFESATIARMLGHLQTVLSGMVASPEGPISSLPLLTAAERQQLLVEWNQTDQDYPQTQCIHQLFEEQADRVPDKVAVSFAEESLTYAELNGRANQLASYLRTLGVGPEVLVGLCVERSLEMLVGLLGILKAGGGYVPLDPAYPEERLTYMLSDAAAMPEGFLPCIPKASKPVVLTQQHLVAHLQKKAIKDKQTRVVCLDSDWDEIAQQSDRNPETDVKPENLAYTIYTSGSTGKPKGVQIEHRSVVNFLTTMSQRPGLTEKDILLAVTTISFDIAGLLCLLLFPGLIAWFPRFGQLRGRK